MAPPTALGELLDDDLDEAPGILLAAYALASWSTVFPDVDEDIVVHAIARPVVSDIAGLCVATTPEGLSAAPDVVALEARFMSADPSTAPGWRELLAENSAGDASTTIPLLVTQGLTDTLVRPPVTQEYVDAQCARGVPLDFRTYAGVDHFALRTAAAPDVVDWLLDRLDGGAAPSGCSTQSTG